MNGFWTGVELEHVTPGVLDKLWLTTTIDTEKQSFQIQFS